MGGAQHDDLSYVAFDLELFTRAPRIAHTSSDVEVGRALLDALRGLPAKTTATRAATILKMVPGNKEERITILDILGYCGVLQSDAHRGYTDAFVPHDSRTAPTDRTDRPYPICWWQADHGVWQDNLIQFLPLLA
jgi:hypothetical protein